MAFGSFGGFGASDPFQLYSPQLPVAPTLRAAAQIPQPQPLDPYDPSILEQIGGTALSGLGWIAGTLDKPGRAIRGLLAGKPREFLNALPLPTDALGITDPDQNVSGRELLTTWGVTKPNDPEAWEAEDVAGFGAELALDPLNYLTLGTKGALTAAGKEAAKVGPAWSRGIRLAQESPEAFAALARGSDDAGRLAAEMAGPYGANDVSRQAFLEAAPKPLEDTLTGRIRAGQAGVAEWNPFGLGDYLPGGRQMLGTSPETAKWIDDASQYVGNLPGVSQGLNALGAAGRGVRQTLDYTTRGASQPDVANVAREVISPGEDVLRQEYGGELFNLMRTAHEGGMTPEQLTAWRRLATQASEDVGDNAVFPTLESWTGRELFGEGAEDAYRNAAHVGRTLQGNYRQFLEQAQDLGIPLQELEDAYVAYAPRTKNATPQGFFGAAKQILSPTTKLNTARREVLKNIPGGTTALNDLAQNVDLLNLPDEEAVEAIARDVLHRDAFGNAHKMDEINNQAAGLLKYLRTRPPEEIGKAIFNEDPLTNFASRTREMARVRSAGEGIQELIKRHAFYDPNGTEGVSVRKFLDSIGGNDWTRRLSSGVEEPVEVLQKGGTSRAAAAIKDKFGLTDDIDPKQYSIPKEIAKEAARLAELWSSPEQMSRLAGMWDSVTNAYKSNLTQYFPAFAGRNLLDAATRIHLSTGLNPLKIAGAMRRAREIMAGGDDPEGLIDAYDLLNTAYKSGVMSDEGMQASAEGVEAFGNRLPKSITNDPNTVAPPLPPRRGPEPPAAPASPGPTPPVEPPAPAASPASAAPSGTKRAGKLPPVGTKEREAWDRSLGELRSSLAEHALRAGRIDKADLGLLEQLARAADPAAVVSQLGASGLAAARRLADADLLEITTDASPVFQQARQWLDARGGRLGPNDTLEAAMLPAELRRAVLEADAIGSAEDASRVADAMEAFMVKLAKGKQNRNEAIDPRVSSGNKLATGAAERFEAEPLERITAIRVPGAVGIGAVPSVKSQTVAGFMEGKKPKTLKASKTAGGEARPLPPREPFPDMPDPMAPSVADRVHEFFDSMNPPEPPSSSLSLSDISPEPAPRGRVPLEAEPLGTSLKRHYLYDERLPYGGWAADTWGETAQMYNPLNIAGVGNKKTDDMVFMRGSRRGNQAIDDWTRLAHALVLKEQGWDDSAIAAELRKWHFDYSRLTDTERKGLRRVAPFYSFSRFNAPLVANELLENPSKYAGAARAVTMGGRNDEGYVPDYIGETLAVPLGQDSEGNDKYLTSLGLGSLEEPFSRTVFDESGVPDIGRTAEKHALMLHPLLRMPIEWSSGRQLLTGRPLDELQANPLVEMLTDDPAEATGWSRVLANSPLSRFGGTAAKILDDRKTPFDKLLNLTTGARVTSVDRDVALERDINNALQEALGESGRIRGRQSYYVPEEAEPFLTDEERMLIELQQSVRSARAKKAKERAAAEKAGGTK